MFLNSGTNPQHPQTPMNNESTKFSIGWPTFAAVSSCRRIARLKKWLKD